jgi:hypothetical protein
MGADQRAEKSMTRFYISTRSIGHCPQVVRGDRFSANTPFPGNDVLDNYPSDRPQTFALHRHHSVSDLAYNFPFLFAGQKSADSFDLYGWHGCYSFQVIVCNDRSMLDKKKQAPGLNPAGMQAEL